MALWVIGSWVSDFGMVHSLAGSGRCSYLGLDGAGR